MLIRARAGFVFMDFFFGSGAFLCVGAETELCGVFIFFLHEAQL
jgi:hypothetical protein